ncbi:MAG: translational repressor RegA [bacterium]
MNTDEILNTFIEIALPDNDSFLKIKETLTRVGISSNQDKKLYQSCHILHKKGRYYLVHFKELFALDGRPATLDQTDISRRNSIARLLQEWGLCDIVGSRFMATDETGKDIYSYPLTMINFCSYNKIKILPFCEKDEWQLVTKYSLGKKKYDTTK